MTDNLILPILKNIQKEVQSSKMEQVNTRNEIQRLRTDMNMQFAALSDKLTSNKNWLRPKKR